ncbi:MAG: hypothetical protein QME68_08345, partial [Elusimicrobiota bacterium]|nr:hypothetical protein [Elusimicrobiota bacterium]
SPYWKSIIYSGRVYSIFKDDIIITPLIKLNLDKAKLKFIADIHNSKVFLLDKTSLPITIVRHTGNIITKKWYEGQLDCSVNIAGPWFLESNIRYTFYGSEKFYDFFAAYFAIAYRLKKKLLKGLPGQIYIRVGCGLDPEGIDEDLLDDFDRREEFLYNKYLTSGESIVEAEKSLRDLKMLSVRAEIRF